MLTVNCTVGRDKNRFPPNFNSWDPNTFGFQHNTAKEDYRQINYHVNVQGDHKKDIREMGAKSTVLLKNINKTLPLKKPKSVAVIGEDAHDNPAGPNECGDRGCNRGTLAMGWGSGTANFPVLQLAASLTLANKSLLVFDCTQHCFEGASCQRRHKILQCQQ